MNQRIRQIICWFVPLGLCASATAAEDFLRPYFPEERARVVVVEDPHATDAFVSNAEVVQSMVDRALQRLTGEHSTSNAWLRLVQTNDVVGIKVHSAPGRVGGTRPVVVRSVINGLITAGVPRTNIVIWDKNVRDLANASYFELASLMGVEAQGATSAGWSPEHFYDNPLRGTLVWGDHEFGREGFDAGRRSYVTTILTARVTRIINISPLLNHNEARVVGSLYSLANGSVDNFRRFEGDTLRLETAVPEIYALEMVGDKVALNIVDALLAQYEGGQRSLLHYSARLNQIRMSRDPVAIDTLSVHELNRLRNVPLPDNIRTNFTLFQNASMLLLGIADTNRIDVEMISQ